ncbi:DUF1702 family protein [Streptomyces yaizuensis]|uniref:DUF1702 family protein n=1 Tax=Streptomyces yaizuensis TaxID=2989713 RepID=A0ABQ5P870_9ACTN|nr:DUF1702 family protein [Streptomyces sp. YSPA8]
METVGRSFLEGYGHAVGTRTVAELEHCLAGVPERFRGFAYEGAAMGATVLDAIPGTGGRRLAALLSGQGRHHVYMAYVGIGWALARLPRPLWPDIGRTDPLIRWLILDGYGFHQAYFHTDRYVRDQRPSTGLGWPWGPAGYLQNAVDQGIGRAVWFVAGTDPDLAATLIEKFPHQRRPDLFSGTGLAAAYACGARADELEQLAHRAGPYRPQLLQGVAFAAEARELAGLTVEQNRLAVRTLTGLEPKEAALVCRRTRPQGPATGDDYERWRRAIADEITSRGERQNP